MERGNTRNHLENAYPDKIYPDIEILKDFEAEHTVNGFKYHDTHTILLKSYLRINHNNIWYDILTQKKWISHRSDFSLGMTRLLNQFHKEVYITLMMHKIKETDIPSHDQRSEQERLKSIYNLK
jgi:hypothetical protein